MTDPIDPLVAGTPEVLRRVAPPAVPWPAGLVRTPTGPGLLVDVDELSDCALWPPAEHVVRPSEVYRTLGGHVALFPALSRPLVPGALSPGAAVTVAVSVLRGMREAGPGAFGCWWLTDAGTPVFVPVRDGDDAVASGAAIVRALAVSGMPPAFADLAAEVSAFDDFDDAAAAHWEERLFRAAEPAAVVSSAPQETPRPRRRPEPADRPSGISMLMRAFDGGLAGALSEAAHSLRRTLRVWAARRSFVVATAAAVAGVVLAVGLGWPQTGDTPADAPIVSVSASQHEAPAIAREPAAGAGRDLIGVARGLLATLSGCAEPGCRARVLEDPTRELPAGVATAAKAELTLLDDLGGLAVIRADAAGARSQIVLLVSRDEKWLVRDVNDVADQP